MVEFKLRMKPKVVFEDEYLLVVDKPSGWITNEARTTKDRPVLQTWLRTNQNFPISTFKEMRSGIVHRLDKETSGVLLVAKTKKVFKNLQLQFKDREIKKAYIALTHGKIEPAKGEINAPVGRLPWNRERFGVLPGGREALTKYETLSYYRAKKGNDFFTLVKLFPKTGRTHQIRIHLKYLGYPIVSDEFYAGRKTARKDRTWCPRLFLHALEISFIHPQTRKRITVKSDLPDDLKQALLTLEEI